VRIFAFTASCVALTCAIACVPNKAEPPPGEEARADFMTRLVDETITPRLSRLEAAAVQLREAAVVFEGSDGVDVAARDDVRAALSAFQVEWQQLEVMHLGPAGAPQKFSGGQGLRDGLLSYPLVSRCGADQQLVQNRMTEEGWTGGRLVNVLGAHTMEYLLYVDGVENACPSAASINSSGSWDAIGAEELQRRRAVYVRVLADDIVTKTQTLAGAWRDGFTKELKAAGTTSTLFPTAQQALDEVYAALFYVELITKDRKLAVPAGIHVDCTEDVCPDLTESPVARQSRVHIENNLRGAQLVFLGTSDDGVDGLGFDDLLRDAGHGDAADVMVKAINDAVAAAAAFDGTIEDALVTEPERVLALHAAVKAFTDELKGTLPSLLGLRVPDEGAGDND
jgi:predicted lipoprotein